MAAENGFKDKDPVDHYSSASPGADKSPGPPTGSAGGPGSGIEDHHSDTSGDVTDTDDTKGLVSNEPQMSDRRKIFLICLICFPQFIGAVQFSMIGSFYPQTVSSS